jgi:hypothetical protein
LLELGRLLEHLEFSAHDQQLLNYLTTFNSLLLTKSFHLQPKQDVKQEGTIRGSSKPPSCTSELKKDTSKKRRQKAKRQHSPKELNRSNMVKRRRLFQVQSCNPEDRKNVNVSDVCCAFRGARWSQSQVSGDWNNCHICGKWNNKLCVGARAVHLQRLSVN